VSANGGTPSRPGDISDGLSDERRRQRDVRSVQLARVRGRSGDSVSLRGASCRVLAQPALVARRPLLRRCPRPAARIAGGSGTALLETRVEEPSSTQR